MQSLPCVVFLKRERRGTEHAGVVAEFGHHDLHVHSTGERMIVDVPRRTFEQHRGGLTDASADDDEPRIERVHDADQRLTEDVTGLQENLEGSLIPCLCGLHHVLRRYVRDVAARKGGNRASAVRLRGGASGRGQRRPPDVRLEMSRATTRTRKPVQPDDDVPDLAAEPSGTAVRLPVEEQRTADTRAERDHHEVPDALAGAEARLPDTGAVSVVVDDHVLMDPGCDERTNVDAGEGQVRTELHRLLEEVDLRRYRGVSL